MSGLVSDDYGFLETAPELQDQPGRKGLSALHSIDIPVNRSTTSQNFVYNWSLDSLKLGQEDKLEYYVQVWDNDGVNGPKSSRSNQLNFVIPTNSEVQKQVDKSAEKTEEEINNALEQNPGDQEGIEHHGRSDAHQEDPPTFQDKKQLQEVLQKARGVDEGGPETSGAVPENERHAAAVCREKPVKLHRIRWSSLQKLFNELLDPESKATCTKQLKQLLERKQDEKASDTARQV